MLSLFKSRFRQPHVPEGLKPAPPVSTVCPEKPAYDIEKDHRVVSALGAEGLAFSRHLDVRERLDPAVFDTAFDAIFGDMQVPHQKEYGAIHRRRFFESFNLAAELTTGQTKPRILDFGVGEHTALYKKLLPYAHITVAEYPNRYGVAHLNVDENYELDLNKASSRDAASIPRHSFDLVVFTEVIEHLYANPVEVLEWLFSLIKPAGYLLLTTPNMFAKGKMVVYLNYDNPLDAFPKEDIRAWGQAHLREYSHIELLRFVQEAGGQAKALLFSACWDEDETLAPVERKNLVLIASPGSSS